MDADGARHAGLDRVVDSGQRRRDLFGRVADQRRQEGGGAETGVRGADRRDGVHVGLVVEQHAAAAVDLRIDEAGEQPAAAQVDRIAGGEGRSEEHTSELQSLMRNSYAVFCLKKHTMKRTKTIYVSHK